MGLLLSELVVVAAVAALGTTYLLYPGGVRLAAKLRQRRRPEPSPPETGGAGLPTLTVVVPAYNEASFIDKKLQQLRAEDYPAERMEVLVVDDGSTDGTSTVAQAAGDGVRVVRRPVRGGKSAALDDGVRAANGEVVVFTDANASLAPGSLRAVAREFRDPEVALTTGAKQPIGKGAHGEGESLYWRLERGLKQDESAFGCVMGADGGIYAVRRSTFRPIPGDVYADDYWLPLDALDRGYRVTQAADARALESVGARLSDDFERRTRIAAGIWAVSLSHLQLADPRRGMVAASFVGHRVLRSIVTPLLLFLALPAAALGRRRSPLLRWLWRAQLAGYGAAVLGALTDVRLFTVPSEFVLVNVASLRGGLRHLRHRQRALWASTTRGPWREAERRMPVGAP